MCDMCKEYISEPYPLSGGRIVRIGLGKVENPSRDLWIARGYVLLPADMRREIKVMGSRLDQFWGGKIDKDFPLPIEGKWRAKFSEHVSDTMCEAMRAAWEYAHAEIMGLEEALRKEVS